MEKANSRNFVLVVAAMILLPQDSHQNTIRKLIFDLMIPKATRMNTQIKNTLNKLVEEEIVDVHKEDRV